MKTVKSKHDELCNTAILWLYAKGCYAFAQEVPTRNGIADALGVKRSGKPAVYYIEAKASRSDLICQKQKAVYQRSIQEKPDRCWYHGTYGKMGGEVEPDAWKNCPDCKEMIDPQAFIDIDFYYLIVADGVLVEPELYPNWGVISESGKTLRRAKRYRTRGEFWRHYEAIAHVLIYKAFGKLYLPVEEKV